ncbi:glucokinase [Paucibacter sp. Y2R2-4]|uniref:glucokinase n=1 Tax=Paucibacter sp. Y2R2-4 TaxID=2893553 RepID=UPI0021E3C1E1|nr:glucokinase [Paucibacter sp. Y2R2-4]MCV2352047.1 glucokinase [Paucibacter sp. Y2R2-4]
MLSASYPCLVADVGGTNARFAWVASAGAPVTDIAVLPVHAHAGPAAAAQSYLSQLQIGLGASYQAPRRAALAVATAVAGDRVELTNGHWSFSRQELQQALGLDSLLVLNDFEALALSLPRLQAGQLRPWPQASGVAGEVAPQASVLGSAPGPTLAVIGPGTGLGVAGVTRVRGEWVALPGEGGHMTLAPGDALESELLAFVRRTYEHVSAERLLSGIGLPLLHSAVAAVRGAAGSPAGMPALPAEVIVERGLARSDAHCEETLEVFCALLGGFAGNVALTLGARGGVFIGGGIVPRLGERFFASRFRERFEAKGRFRGYLADIPTALITDTLAALGGSALALDQQHD